jgi:cytochrome c biogenesis protein CcmG/thiol:disulfide interchange protein DsbE
MNEHPSEETPQPGKAPEAPPRSPWRRVLKGVELVVWVAVLAFLAHRLWPQVAAVVGVGRPGEAVPSLAVTTLDGRTLSTEDLRGRVVLLNFWATWCPPCRVEMPGFQKLYQEHREEGFVILGLATDVGGDGPVRAFLEERGITYPVAMVGSDAKQAFGGVPLLPTSILVDRQGIMRHRVEGFFAPPALGVAVRRLLDEGSGRAIRFRDAWARPARGGGEQAMSGGYLSLVNGGSEPDTLLEVRAPEGVSVEVHRTILEGDIARMRPAGPVEIPAEGSLVLEPGGLHLMIHAPSRLLEEGDTLALEFVLARAGTIPVRVPVELR